MNTAIYLTYLRILLIPMLLISFLTAHPGYQIVSAAIFALAAFTDWLDGYWARKYQQETSLGAFLDPVADKLIVSASLIMLTMHYDSIILLLMSMLIIMREIVISALREWMARQNLSSIVAVSKIGKWKTTVQMLAIGGLILQKMPLINVDLYVISMILLFIACILTVWSMLDYFRAAINNS